MKTEPRAHRPVLYHSPLVGVDGSTFTGNNGSVYHLKPVAFAWEQWSQIGIGEHALRVAKYYCYDVVLRRWVCSRIRLGKGGQWLLLAAAGFVNDLL